MSVRRKVLVVLPRFDVGGTERHLLRMATALRGADDVDLNLFVLERGGSLEAAATAAGIALEGSAQGPLRVPRAALALWRTMRRTRPDIVHFFLPEAYLVGWFVALAARVSLRIMSRRSLAVYQQAHPMLARIERWLHRRTHILLGNSKAVADQLIAECGEPGKVGVIFNGIALPFSPESARGAARASLDIPDQALVLIIVANLLAYKGHADLIAALAGIAGRLPQPWRLVVVGRDDGIGSSLQREAQTRGLSGNILWLGQRMDVERLLAAADVALLPSHQEGFSNSLIEAMAAGMPVVATAVGGNLDAVVNGETGLLVPPQASDALGEAILALASDPARRARMGAAGRARVADLFSLEACVARYRMLYRRVGQEGFTRVQDILDQAVSPVAEGDAGRLGNVL